MFKIGDKVRILPEVDDDGDGPGRGSIGTVVAVWPPDGEFQYGVQFPEDREGESWSYAEEEVERA